ncbi:MAG: matrixin family metalloprotease [Chthonomonas sp.]|nr:matrixin family metalloprotease [Chthonomonas sp.]
MALAAGAATFVGHHRVAVGKGCELVDFAAKEKFAKQLENRPEARRLGPVAACFAEGTDPQVMAAFHQALQEAQDGAWPNPDERYNLTSRWSGAQGSPRVIRWSFVPDGLSIPSGVGEAVANSTLFASMDAKFSGNRALWISKFEEVFNRWSQVTGLTYVRVTSGGNDWDDGADWGQAGADGLRGDVRISSKNIDGASSTLAYNFFPSNGDMVIDSSENWGSSTNDYRFLRNTLSHEHGHGMGLLHVCPIDSTKLMEPYLNTGFNGPQQDDIRAGTRHYGDSNEPDNTAATATPVGAVGVGTSVTLGTYSSAANSSTLSIDADGEEDYYQITTSGPVRLTATATPVGSSYNSATANPCGTNAVIAAQSQANLAIEVQNSTGTVLASASGGGLAIAESVILDISAAGTYNVRVYETNSPTQSQLYRLDLLGEAIPTATISGRITFLDWVNPNSTHPVIIEVIRISDGAQIALASTTTDSDGDYTISVPSLVAGTGYLVRVSSLVWLRKSTPTIGAATISNLNFSLFNGDADQSGEVDAADIDDVIAAFGGTGVGPTGGDLDGSGEVDASDIDVAIANFGQIDN